MPIPPRTPLNPPHGPLHAPLPPPSLAFTLPSDDLAGAPRAAYHVDLHRALIQNGEVLPGRTSSEQQPPLGATSASSRVMPLDHKGDAYFDTTHTSSYRDLSIGPLGKRLPPPRPIRPRLHGKGMVIASDPHPIDGSTYSRAFTRFGGLERHAKPQLVRPTSTANLMPTDWMEGTLISEHRSQYAPWSGLPRARSKPILPKVNGAATAIEAENTPALTRSTSEAAFTPSAMFLKATEGTARARPIVPSHRNILKVDGVPTGTSTSRASFVAPPAGGVRGGPRAFGMRSNTDKANSVASLMVQPDLP
jgi:hypothetical protein